MKHGTSGYQKHKCRCDICVRANAEHKRKYREQHPVAYPSWRRLCQWPLQPLLELVPDLYNIINPDHQTWHRAQTVGLSDRVADHWAVKAGWPPALVWDGWVDAGLFAGDDLYVNGGPGAEPGWRQAALHTDSPKWR